MGIVYNLRFHRIGVGGSALDGWAIPVQCTYPHHIPCHITTCRVYVGGWILFHPHPVLVAVCGDCGGGFCSIA